MTQAPTPGPLTSESVKLLVKGDLLRFDHALGNPIAAFKDMMNGVVLYATGDNGMEYRAHPHAVSFIGRPDAEGWMPWSGGENPVGEARVEVKYRNGETEERAASRFGWTHWEDPDRPKLGVYDIIAFRLAPTAPVENPDEPCAPENAIDWPPAPVEASGSERERLARAIDPYAWDDGQYAEPGGKGQQWSQEAARKAADRFLALRPQREAVAQIIDPKGWEVRDGQYRDINGSTMHDRDRPLAFANADYYTRDSLTKADAILALLSARPLALGGQEGVGLAASEIGAHIAKRDAEYEAALADLTITPDASSLDEFGRSIFGALSDCPAMSIDKQADFVARALWPAVSALRPQPSGETREQMMGGGDVIALVDPTRWDCPNAPQLSYANGWNDALSARPLALGGQEGEERLPTVDDGRGGRRSINPQDDR